MGVGEHARAGEREGVGFGAGLVGGRDSGGKRDLMEDEVGVGTSRSGEAGPMTSPGEEAELVPFTAFDFAVAGEGLELEGLEDDAEEDGGHGDVEAGAHVDL